MGEALAVAKNDNTRTERTVDQDADAGCCADDYVDGGCACGSANTDCCVNLAVADFADESSREET